MRLLDNVRNILPNIISDLEQKCPFCGNNAWKFDDSKHFPEAECNVCHLRIQVTTRNNSRMGVAILLTFLAFVCGLLLGVL